MTTEKTDHILRLRILWRGLSRRLVVWLRNVPLPERSLLQFLREHVLPNTSAFLENKTPLVWLLAMVIGVGVAYVAILFRLAISVIQLPWLGTMSERVFEAASALPWYAILLAPAIGGLLVGLLLQYVMPGRRPQTVADVIEVRADRDCHIPLKTGLVSALISVVSLGSGASAGREGPVVHLGATLAANLESFFKLPRSAQRTLLACGVAAAVSASFNAPIAAVLFAHEVILAHYALSAFVPIVISSVIGTVVTRVHWGDFPAFIVPDYQITSYWEFPAFALLGLTCAAVAILFQFSIVFADRISRGIDVPLWMRPVIGGLMVGGIALFYPQVLGVGYDAMDATLNQKFSLNILLALLCAKTAATAITLASRFGGGVFSPSLYLGAMAGGAFGLIAGSVFPEMSSSHGTYALVGMGAVAAAVLGAPISTTLIVFELTGGYAVTIALLLAVSISTGLTQAVHGVSFFHWQLRDRGIFLHEGPHGQIVRTLQVADFMTALEDGEVPEPLNIEAGDVSLMSDHSVETALRSFDQAGKDRLPVTDRYDPNVIIGWADHLAALRVVNQALVEAHVEEHR